VGFIVQGLMPGECTQTQHGAAPIFTAVVSRIALLLLRSFLAPFAVTLPVALFVLDMQFLWVYADDLIGKGLDPLVIAELMVYASARLVNLALPLAILMAAIMGVGKLAERNELTAMKSAGMPLIRILRPLTVCMVLISIGAFQFSNVVWPLANLKFRALLYSVTQKRPTLHLEPGVFYTGIEGFAIRADAVEADGTLIDVLIHDHREGETGASRVIRAARGRMDQTPHRLVLTLEDGRSYEEDLELGDRRAERIHPHVTTRFKRNALEIDLASLDFSQVDEGLFQRVHEMMTVAELEVAMDSLQRDADARRADVLAFGLRSNVLFADSLSTAHVRPEQLTAGLGAAQRRLAYDSARDACRNARQGVLNALEDARIRERARDRHAVEWHRKFFLGTSCLLLFFIGAPLGAIIRKGGLGLPTLFAIGVFLVYYIVSIVGEQLIRSEVVSPAIGMWMSTAVLLPVAVVLTRAAMQDAHVLFALRWPSFVAFTPRKRLPT
jgi:lipopolysaccharide export system permease protein